MRYVNLWSGGITFFAVVIFVAALLLAGIIQNMFRSERTLRVILPDTGVAGLSAGAQVQVLGTKAGRVSEIVLDPKKGFHAVLRIDKSMEPFVRSDSDVFLRKQFGIAGAAFIEITRGRGDALDWDYAVLTAHEDAAPAEAMTQLVDFLRGKMVPAIEDARRTLRATAELVEGLNAPAGKVQTALGNLSEVSTRIAEGEGNVGRILRDDRMVRDMENAVAEVTKAMASVSGVVNNLQATSSEVVKMAAGIGKQSQKLPELIDTTNATLKSLNVIMVEMSRTLPEITVMVRNSAEASKALPTLLAQTQQTLSELEQLLLRFQGSWLLGVGGSSQSPERGNRLSPIEVRP